MPKTTQHFYRRSIVSMLNFTPVRTKYIFVTGGVCSSLGKGIAAASCGLLLKAAGYRVSMIKLDPYLNVDPGTMNPYQHGEVFVTDDGAETDLDLGHYERFIDEPLGKHSTVTTGRLYSEMLQRERQGDFLGGTIQIIPHITGAIVQKVKAAGRAAKADVVIAEIGGTVGDIEGEPFLEAARQLKHAAPKDTAFVHLTLLPYLAAADELKTKPTQASVRELRRIGISPDVILTRADVSIPQGLLTKIALFCDVEKEAVIPAETLESIYDVPLHMEKSGLTKLLQKKLGLPQKAPRLTAWNSFAKKRRASTRPLRIVGVGKYGALADADLSAIEALKAAIWAKGYKPDIIWVDAEKLEKKDTQEWKTLRSAAGIYVPGVSALVVLKGK